MKIEKLKLSIIQLQNRMAGEEGQDLIEYALVVAPIALAATAGMTTVASDINVALRQHRHQATQGLHVG